MNVMKRRDVLTFNIIGYFLIGLTAIFCLVPFLLVVSGSFTSEESIFKYGYRLIPKDFSLHAYEFIFQSWGEIANAYVVTICLTAVGTGLGLFITAMTSYVLQKRSFRYRNHFSFFFFFTTLFNGGLVPWYILITQYYKMQNTFFAMLLPMMINVMYLILMKNFMRTIPESISESAYIDGAGEFTIFLRIILPLSGPSLATIGLFMALGYWNDWYNAMLFIQNKKLFPLQYFLYNILSKVEFAASAAEKSGVPQSEMPQQSFKLAMTVIVTGPILFFYPFVQKYFVKGITVGAVKG